MELKHLNTVYQKIYLVKVIKNFVVVKDVSVMEFSVLANAEKVIKVIINNLKIWYLKNFIHRSSNVYFIAALNADQKFIDGVDGLRPNLETHDWSLNIEPV